MAVVTKMSVTDKHSREYNINGCCVWMFALTAAATWRVKLQYSMWIVMAGSV